MKFLPHLLLTTAFSVTLVAQDATAAKSNRSMGEVTAIDGASLALRPDNAGGTVTVTLDPKTRFLRVPPTDPEIKKATTISPTDIGVGDRVLVVTRAAEAGKPALATTIVVMTRQDLAKKQAADQAQWQQRGVSGTVTAVDAQRNQIVIDTRTREGKKSMTVEAAGANVRRYAPDSIRFSDAKPSGLAEVKVGDQVRVLGEKNTEETQVKAQEIVAGTFQNIAGTVSSIDPAAGEVKITNLATKKPMTVKVNPDSTLRRLPQQLAMMLANRLNAGGAGGEGGFAGPRPGASPDARFQRPAGDVPSGAPGGNRPGGMRGPGGPGGGFGEAGAGFGRGAASGDLSQMIDRLPPLQLSELKPGDAIVVASTAGSDPTRATAITVLAGVEPLLTAPRQQDGRLGGQWNFDINIVPQ